MPCMETLGLSGPPQPRDSLFRRLFWPSDNAGDADILGQQGFWVCLIVGMLSCLIAIFQGHWIAGIFVLVVFTLGGIGVREHDVLAAISVTLLSATQIFAAIVVLHRPPGILDLFIILLLLANIRGCRIAAKWSRLAPETIPERMNETWRDKLVDQMPARVWPKAKYAYYILFFIDLLLSLAGIGAMLHHPHP